MKPLLAAAAAFFFSSGSWAALGAAPANLGPHAASPTFSTVSTGLATYTLVQKDLDSGTTVREYVDANGTVFAVSWSGPFLPDLKEILGGYFDAMVAQAGQGRDARHSGLAVRRSGVVIISSGHMGALEGRAWLPAKLPPGFDVRGAK